MPSELTELTICLGPQSVTDKKKQGCCDSCTEQQNRQKRPTGCPPFECDSVQGSKRNVQEPEMKSCFPVCLQWLNSPCSVSLWTAVLLKWCIFLNALWHQKSSFAFKMPLCVLERQKKKSVTAMSLTQVNIEEILLCIHSSLHKGRISMTRQTG